MKNKLLSAVTLFTLLVGGMAFATALTTNQKDFIKIALPDNTLATEVSNRLDGVDNLAKSATATVGAEGANTANVITVTFQFKDEAGANLPNETFTTCWISQATTGLGLATTAGTSAFVIRTYGTLIKSDTTGLLGRFVTDAAGKLAIDVTQTSATVPNEYLVCTGSLGKLNISGVIDFN